MKVDSCRSAFDIEFDESVIRTALAKAWSLETAKQWTPETPAAGQCSVMAVVVYDLFRGDMLRTKLPDYEVYHYYNRIAGFPAVSSRVKQSELNRLYGISLQAISVPR